MSRSLDLTSGDKTRCAKLVRTGIARHGFHLCGPDEIHRLWTGEEIHKGEFRDLIHKFAADRGWRVVVKESLDAALFVAQEAAVHAENWKRTGRLPAVNGKRTGRLPASNGALARRY